MARKKLFKIIFYSACTIALLIVVTILFLSPIAKHLIEKHDVEYTGREIKVERVYINPFTGYIQLEGLQIFESKSDSVFITAQDLSGNISLRKLFSKTFELNDLTLNNPRVTILQNKKELNFTDLIKRFSEDKPQTKKKTGSLKVNLLNIKIINGDILYLEHTIPVRYSITKLNVETKGKMWDADSINTSFSLESGIGSGTMNGSAMLNTKTLAYRFETNFKKFDLSVMEQYLRDITNAGNLDANMDAALRAKGNLKNPEDIDLEGLLSVNDFHFGRNKEDYLAFKKITLNIKQLHPKAKKYLFDSLSLVEPYFLYERYDSLDNIQNMFGKKGRKISAAKANSEKPNLLFQLADYVKILAKNFFKSNYEINRIAVYAADLHYSDYSLSEKFEIAASPLFITADSIKRSNKWVNVLLKTKLKPYGHVDVNLSINPKDSSDFDINYRVKQVPATVFNPYLVKYTSYPLKRGTISLEGTWHVTNGNIKSKNHLTVIDPRISTREKQNASKILPLKFIMFFIRERGNVIDYEVPITGDLKNPEFKFNDVIFDALINLLIKPPTALYRTEVSELENEIENAFDFSWAMNSDIIEKDKRKFADELSEHLIKNPKVVLHIKTLIHEAKEKEKIALFEARKMYYHSLNPGLKLTDYDTTAIIQIPVKDKSFMRFLDQHTKNKIFYTVQDKCISVVGESKINQLYERLNLQRKKRFLSSLKITGAEKRIQFSTLSKIPYNGLSCYRIEYNGVWPDELITSFNRMNDLDNKTPRNKFSTLRKKNKEASFGN